MFYSINTAFGGHQYCNTIYYRWAGEEIHYSFVNFSTHAGEELTRKIVTTAITQYSQTIKLAFKEVNKDENAHVTFMFIRNLHADGAAFYGSGKEKAHAYSPVHGEIHFNDWERFTETGAEKGTTSLLYTALHELGHALGLRHSSLNEAVMHASYNPKNTVFTRDDKLNLFVHYEEGAGSISDGVESNDVGKYWKYMPKLPLPRECHSQIDAGLTYKGAFYLISNAFIWKYTLTTKYELQPGYPRRVNEVFPAWTHETYAAFEESGLVYLLSESSVSSYTAVKGNSDLFTMKSSMSYVSMFNPRGKSQDIEPVLAAFTEGKTTTLVINTNLYYKITWAKKKVLSLTRFDDAAGTDLLGKMFEQHEFNAGIAYSRRNKQGTLLNQVWQFGQSIAKSGAVFPVGEPKNPGWGKVDEMFSIQGWCVRKDG